MVEGGSGIADFRGDEFGAYGLKGGVVDGVGIGRGFRLVVRCGAGSGRRWRRWSRRWLAGGIDVARGFRSRAERHSLPTGSPKG